MSKLEQIRALKNGNGIQYLVNEAQKILGNPIATFDTDYKVIAYSELGVDDRFWNELTTTGTFSHESQIFFMNARFTDEVANAKRLALMQSDELQYDRISGHIFNGNGIKVANVLIMEAYESLDSDMIEAFGYLTELLTEEIRNDEFYIAYGESYQDTWIKRLIDYNIDEKRLYSPHVQILYDGFKANLYLALADISLSGNRDKGCKHFVDLFRREHGDFKYSVYDGRIVMIISSNFKVFNAKKEFRNFDELFERENILVGVSRGFDNLFDLRKYYAEAVCALKSAKDSSDQRVCTFDESVGE